MNAKPFTLAQVLSITTGRLCCDMGGVYEILNHITGDNLFTHVLPRAYRFAAPLILSQYAELAAAGTEESLDALDNAIKSANTPMDGVREWLSHLSLAANYQIRSHADQWDSKSPLQDLADEIGEDRVAARCAVVVK